jgi:hypothetical protein
VHSTDNCFFDFNHRALPVIELTGIEGVDHLVTQVIDPIP